MSRQPLSLHRRLALNASRLVAIVLGFWLAALLPVDAWIDHRRAGNARDGLLPNMDPGVVMSIAILFALALLVVVLIVECVRCWALGRAPLSLPACVGLGVCASWPVGWYFAVRHFPCGPAGVFVFSALSIAAFHAIRARWPAMRGR